MSLKGLIVAAALVLTGSTAATAQDQEAVGLGTLAPIQPDYKAVIVAWSRFFFAEPRALRAARISDPVLTRDGKGRLIWLVCVEVDNAAASARPIGPARYAFGFAPAFFTGPRQRNGSPLVNGVCDERTLALRRFPELSTAP